MSSSDFQAYKEVFHAGERAVQTRVGVRERLAEVGSRVIRDSMPEQHRQFFPLLPFLIVGSVDQSGQPWASVIAAPPGFALAPDSRHLMVRAPIIFGDPLQQNLKVGAALGVLGLEPHTRRRNRVNGVIESVDDEGFSLGVKQSFGNCPKYIQAREPVFIEREKLSLPKILRSKNLDESGRALVANADTFFIASAFMGNVNSQALIDADAPSGVDVSHRGGKPGFVRVTKNQAHEDVLLAPDYAGNFFFNTLGNLTLEPRAGLLFIDFENGDLIYLAVIVKIIWEGPALQEFAGAQRLLHMTVTQQIKLSSALPLRWGSAQLSPYL